MGAAALICAAMLGCASSDEHKQLLIEGESAYRAKDYPRSINRLSEFIDLSEQSDDVPRAMYVRGLAYAYSGRREQAYRDLSNASALSTREDVRWRAQAAMGQLYFDEGDWPAAVQALMRAVEAGRESGGRDIDLLMIRLGAAQERSGRWADSYATFERLLKEYPDSKFGPAAARRLELRAEHFSVQAGAFAETPNADKFAAELRAKGFNAFVRRDSINNVVRYYVLVGRFPKYEDAERERAKVGAYVNEPIIWP
jgi:tetratricopeptide (TPR) repeat protein